MPHPTTLYCGKNIDAVGQFEKGMKLVKENKHVVFHAHSISTDHTCTLEVAPTDTKEFKSTICWEYSRK